ncbi:hypothetical protein GSI_12000 [Ganoderma sinense ZZ0214-1]|uniref:Uncharacterized protein n=1 Tax=Ganoderma sinense ZZ0214-1 TaxID=1077348 RepID=A0A2G8RXM4_9APHY|nr:hypothetical protein GSI_12000 [Ganoderma sinense ZZ0214-1]
MASISIPPPVHSVYVARILRLQPELGGMFADHMDMLSLTRWRLTCKSNYWQVSAALRRSLLSLIRPFVPLPHALLEIMLKYHAVFGGELALSFVLRDPAYTPADLEIYTSDYEFGSFCAAVVRDPHIRGRAREYELVTHNALYSLRRLVGETLHIRLSNGRSIYIRRSYNSSAAAPLSRTPCTALSNFVSPYGFACSHPSLTLNRRALLADLQTPFLVDLDVAVMTNLRAHRFSFATSPSEWPEYRRDIGPLHIYRPSVSTLHPDTAAGALHIVAVNTRSIVGAVQDTTTPDAGDPAGPRPFIGNLVPAPPVNIEPPGSPPHHGAVHDISGSASLTVDAPASAAPGSEHTTVPPRVYGGAFYGTDCWRHRFVCPSQSRYFGDRGSFIEFFDPLGGHEALCAAKNIAPFGPMVVWRIMSSYECVDDCGICDDIMEEGVTSIAVLFKQDPYVDLRYIASNRYTGRRATHDPFRFASYAREHESTFSSYTVGSSPYSLG